MAASCFVTRRCSCAARRPFWHFNVGSGIVVLEPNQFESGQVNLAVWPSMKPSPIGSKLLSGYAILFAGLAPAGLAIVALTNGMGVHPLGNVALGIAVIYFGVRVFIGDTRR